MNYATKAIVICAGLTLSACANIETATRQAPFEALPTAASSGDTVTRTQIAPTEVVVRPSLEGANGMPRLRIASYSVVVPRSLRASEANIFYPLGDIVWRGDPLGDRHQQVAAIFEDSLKRSASVMTDGRPARVEIVVQRFHSVTEKTRATTGGTHSIEFQMQAFDADTGAPLMAPRNIKADLNAYGGARALEAEQKGHTQKFRVTNHLIKTIHKELTGEMPKTVLAKAVPLDTAPAVAAGSIALN